MIKKPRRAKLCAMLLLFALLAGVFTGCGGNGGSDDEQSPYIEGELLAFAKQHESFTLAEFLSFEWDVAYLEPMTYGSGKYICDKYGLQFEAENILNDENFTQLYFFNKGVKVWEAVIERGTIDMEAVYPNTLFIPNFWPDKGYGESMWLSAHSCRRIGCELPLPAAGAAGVVEQLRRDELTRNYITWGYSGHYLGSLKDHSEMPFTHSVADKQSGRRYYYFAWMRMKSWNQMSGVRFTVEGETRVTAVECYSGVNGESPFGFWPLLNWRKPSSDGDIQAYRDYLRSK